MTTTPEIPNQPETGPVGVEMIPETPNMPNAEEVGVTVHPTNFTAQVTDDSGQNLTQSPATSSVTIQIPDDQAALEEKSKGSITDSVTWYAFFWLRLIKKALHRGWHVMVGPKGEQQQ